MFRKTITVAAVLTLIGLSVVALPLITGHTFSAKVYAASTTTTPGCDSTKDPTCCPKHTFLGLKPWYEYLPLTGGAGGQKDKCVVNLQLSNQDQTPNASNVNQLWLIGIVIFEDLLRVAGFVAVIFVVYGGIRYITSQGQPENTKVARETIINAMIGLVIAIIGATIVAFIGNKLGG